MPDAAAGDCPDISVVVPFFNCAEYIRDCIESLLEQDAAGVRYEIILINNRSTDASASIAARYAGITVLNEDTVGAYAARNTGIRFARAPLIAFTDADCEVGPSWLSSIREGMRDPSIAVLLGRCRYPAGASLPLRLLGSYENAKTEYVINNCDKANYYAYTNNMAVRASVFAELGLFKEWRRAADSEFVQRLALRRPNLRLAFSRKMKITHLEFLSARARARRLLLYTHTNSKIDNFRELSLMQRLGLLGHMLRGLISPS